ncbi:MAG: DUF11 domain-containing protein [Deltaproteobacteria bacterium]|nr:DUF11 domain-containing protein [Deltaproteobacteria bacterium]
MRLSIRCLWIFAVTWIVALALTPAGAATPGPGVAAADLQIRAAAVTFAVGLPGRYVIALTNSGPNTTNDPIVFHTELPDGLSFASISAGWTCTTDGALVRCTSGSPLGAQSGTSFGFEVNVAAAAVPRVFVQLTVDYAGDPNSANNTLLKGTSVKPARRPPRFSTATPSTTPSFGTPLPTRTPTRTVPPTHTSIPTLTRTATSTRTPIPSATDITLKKTNFGAFATGHNGTYTLTVSNVGASDTNSLISVVDTLPSGLGYVSASGTDWDCSAASGIVMCNRLVPLPAAALSTITLIVSVDESAYPTVTNSATVIYSGDTDLTNNLSRKPTTVKHSRPAAR